MKRRILPLTLAAAGILTWTLVAHPMGNFSVSHYTRLDVSAKGVDVTYVLDLAEIPTYQLLKEWKLDPKAPQAALDERAAAQAKEWMHGLEFRAAGKPLEPKFIGAEIKIADGAGGLSVARIASTLHLDTTAARVDFEDHNFPERAGWKEIVIRSAGADILEASHTDVDRAKALTEYPADPAIAPPQDLRASVEWRPTITKRTQPKIVPVEQPQPVATQAATPVASPGAPAAPGTVVKGDFLSRMLGQKEIGLGLMLIGIAVAFGLGAVHALSPGHGKTIVAAYLVGSRGTPRHAAFLGAMVTFTHTISVFALGLATLFISKYVVPEKIIPVLGAISGLSIVVIGGSLFLKRLRRLRSHDHHHEHDHGYSHTHDHAHDHNHAHDHVHAHDHAHAHVTHRHDHADLHTHRHDHHAEEQHAEEQHHHDHDREHAHAHGHPHTHDHPHAHDQGHVHDHSHTHDHDHGPHGHSHVPEGDITLGSLIALGASGGLVPCPSALVLLLSSIALGHIGLGLILLVAFSLGLAGVLMAIGMLVLYAKHLLPDPTKTSEHPLFRLVPVLSAVVIVCLGLLMTGVSLGWVRPGGLVG